jgi:hypothetical protein
MNTRIDIDKPNVTQEDLINLFTVLDLVRIDEKNHYETWANSDFTFHTEHIIFPNDRKVPFYDNKIRNAYSLLVSIYGRNHLRKFIGLLDR